MHSSILPFTLFLIEQSSYKYLFFTYLMDLMWKKNLTGSLNFFLPSLSPSHLVGCVRSVNTTTWFDEHLTEENQEYMRRSVAQEYRRQTADSLNPLKDEPWRRHEWTQGGCGVIADGCVDCESPFRSLALQSSFQRFLCPGSRRVGLVAVKLGMAPIWTKTGERHVATMLQVAHTHTHTRCALALHQHNS